jgi:hypothetical protein
MNIYTNGKKHKNDTFRNAKNRNIAVKELRKNNWTVKVGVYHYPDSGIQSIYWYEAIK